jgi:5-oxoprolinase (ATP-hydrolysing)
MHEKRKAEEAARKRANRSAEGGDNVGYDRGGTMSELIRRCKADTGLEPPRPQWERDPYGPHTGLPYVKEWYRKMREEGFEVWDRI